VWPGGQPPPGRWEQIVVASIGSTALAAIFGTLDDQIARLRYAGSDATLNGTVEQTFIAGIERTNIPTENGTYNSIAGAVRYDAANEPAAWSTNNAIVGEPVDVLEYGKTEWAAARVASRTQVSGAVRLQLNAEFQEI